MLNTKPLMLVVYKHFKQLLPFFYIINELDATLKTSFCFTIYPFILLCPESINRAALSANQSFIFESPKLVDFEFKNPLIFSIVIEFSHCLG
ncbi:MAG TPA: hypothetical protein DCX43_06425 [Psychrobacter sp.]|nr:hypothetical protein [Psychrobacter sp.]